jgi:hypothetical protein
MLANMPAFPEGIRAAIDVQLDWRVIAYTMGVATLTGVLFGLAPALQSSRTDVSTVLKDDATAFAGGYRLSRVRAALVVTQVACSLLLLIAAGLVLRSLDKVRPTRLGFSSENVWSPRSRWINRDMTVARVSRSIGNCRSASARCPVSRPSALSTDCQAVS